MKNIKTLRDLLYFRARKKPNFETYQQLDDQLNVVRKIKNKDLLFKAEAISERISALTKKKEIIALFYTSRVEFIEAFFGAILSGRKFIILNLPSSIFYNKQSERIQKIFQTVEVKLGLYSGLDIGSYDYFMSQNDHLKSIRWVDTDTVNANVKSTGPRDIKIQPKDTAFIQFTSGTTADPRGVELNHLNILLNLANIKKMTRLNSKTKVINWLPHSHDMGLVGGYLTALFVGGQVFQLKTQDYLKNPLSVLMAVSRHQLTTTLAPAFSFSQLNALADRAPANLNLKTLRVIFNGSEMIQPQALTDFYQKYSKLGLRENAIFPCYGLAEATLIVTGDFFKQQHTLFLSRSALVSNEIKIDPHHSQDSLRVASCGRPQKGTQVVIDSADKNHIGEILISGPTVISKYWKNKSRDRFIKIVRGRKKQIFFRTHDLGFMHRGCLYVLGRQDDVIIHNGEKIHNFDVSQKVSDVSRSIVDNGVLLFSEDGKLTIGIEIKKEEYKNQNLDNIKKLISATLFKSFLLNPKIVLCRAGILSRTTSGKLIRNKSIEILKKIADEKS